MKLKWKRDNDCIITRYTAEAYGYKFAIVAANARCVMLSIGPDQFGPYPNMKMAKKIADWGLSEIEKAENQPQVDPT